MKHSGSRHHSTFALRETHACQDVPANIRAAVEHHFPDIAEWYDESVSRHVQNILFQAVRDDG